MSYVHLETEEALVAKWKRGEEQYGTVFVGHPLLELDEELLDAINYVAEAERQGWQIPGARRLLFYLRAAIRALYFRMPTRPAPEDQCPIR
jgi:hypothetical protein